MPLVVMAMEEADLPTYYDIVHEAGRHDIFTQLMWPDGYPERTRDWSVGHSITDMRTQGDTDKYMKVVDTELPTDDSFRQIVGIAKWNVFPRDRTDAEMAEAERKNKERGMPPAINVDFVTDFFG